VAEPKKSKAKKKRPAKPIGSPARGAASVPTKPETDEERASRSTVKGRRIFQIAKMMLAGEWNARASHKQLGKEWAIAIPTVRSYASEASRYCDLVTGQRAKLVDISRLRLHQVSLEDEPDRVMAARTLLESLGELRQRSIVTEGNDPLTTWTDAELEVFAASGTVPERFKK
jgi:hypothetical protein